VIRMNVKILVLKTGEQLLSEVQEETKQGYLLKKPAILVPAGEKGIGLAAWMPYTKVQTSGVLLKHDAIVCVMEPVDELANHYSGSFASGLVIPSTSVATPQLQLVEG